MAESTSVGKIQLDIEINPQSLNSEMAKLNKMFSGSFKNMFSGMARQSNNLVKESISRIGNSFKNFAQAGTDSNEKVSKSVSKLNNQYEKTQEEIRKIQEELTTLDAQRDAIIQKYINLPPLSGMTQEETLEQMLSKDKEFTKLGVKIEELEMKMAPLNQESERLSNAMQDISESTDKASRSTKRLSNFFKIATKHLFGFSMMKKIFTRETDKATKTSNRFGNTLGRVTKMLVRRLIVYQLLGRVIQNLVRQFWAALKTNEQFSRSLNQIKTNLLVAFQPIYDFIIPVLNALMQAIARVTQYIATAISALFGKTYQQSFNAAKSMNSAIKGMDGYGKAAKKAGKEAKGALMGFDEINQLDIKDDADSGGGSGTGDFEMTMPDTSTIDLSRFERFKEMMATMFEPFKLAWEKEGLNTINSAKRAFESMKSAIGAIGKSFREVWTGGSGQEILESLLRILQLIFNIIGDIAIEFKKAWENNNNGTKLIQSIFDALQSVLLLIESIGNSWREVWNNGTGQEIIEDILGILTEIFTLVGNIADSFRIAWETNNAGVNIIQNIADAFNIVLEIIRSIGESLNEVWGEVGQSVVNAFMGILEATTGVLKKVAEGFREIWDRGGKHLFKSLIKLGAKIFEIAGYIYTEFVAPFVMWFIDMIAPAIGIVLDWIGHLVDGITWLLDGFLKFLGGVKEFVEGVVSFFKWLYDTLVGNSIVPDLINGITEWFEKLFKNVTKKVKDLVDAVVKFFTEMWNSIKENTEEAWNAIKNFLINSIWNPIKNTAKTIWEGIRKNIIDPIEQSWTKLKELWDKIKKYILDKWDEIKTGISSKKNSLIDAIKSPFLVAEDWINGVIRNAFNWGKNLIGEFISGIKSMAGRVTDAISGVVGGIKDFIGFSSPTKEGPGSDADKWMPNMMEMFAAGIEDNIAQVSSAINMTAGSIQQGVQPNTDDMASAVGSAVLQSMQMVENNQGQESGDIILQIDGITVGRILGPIMDREKERIGEPVIKPI